MRGWILAALAVTAAQPAHAALHVTGDIPFTDVRMIGSGCAVASDCYQTTTGSLHLDSDILAPTALAIGEQFAFVVNGVGHLIMDPHYEIDGEAIYRGGGVYDPVWLGMHYTPACCGEEAKGTTASFTLTDPAAPAVPEPATWAMMLTGLAGVAAVLRRRAPHPA